MSRTSADAGAGENRQYRGPASEATDFREQLFAASETRFRRSASDPILGAAGASSFLSVWVSRPAKRGAQGKGKKQERGRKEGK